MEKTIAFLLCITFIFLISGCNKEPEKATTETHSVTLIAQNQTESATATPIKTKELYRQYLNIIKKYEETYGTITEERKIEATNNVTGGVSYYTLIDFNADGCEELLIVFDNNTPEKSFNGALSLHIYSYTGKTVEQVYSDHLQISEKHKLNGDYLWLARQDNKTHLVENIYYEQDGALFGGYSYSSFDGAEFTKLFETASTNEGNKSHYLIDNKECTQEEFIAKNKTVNRYYFNFSVNRSEANKTQNQFTLDVLKSGKVHEPSTEE